MCYGYAEYTDYIYCTRASVERRWALVNKPFYFTVKHAVYYEINPTDIIDDVHDLVDTSRY